MDEQQSKEIESIDELAQMCELWSKLRSEGITPTGVKAGILSICVGIAYSNKAKRKRKGNAQQENGNEKTNDD